MLTKPTPIAVAFVLLATVCSCTAELCGKGLGHDARELPELWKAHMAELPEGAGYCANQDHPDGFYRSIHMPKQSADEGLEVLVEALEARGWEASETARARLRESREDTRSFAYWYGALPAAHALVSVKCSRVSDFGWCHVQMLPPASKPGEVEAGPSPVEPVGR